MANFTKLLLHCDGVDGSTSFDDASIYNKTVTANGNAQVDTAQKVFGTGSALFDGTGDYLTMSSTTDFQFGNGNFTIDFRIRFVSHAALAHIFDYGPSTDRFNIRYDGSNLVCTMRTADVEILNVTKAWSPSNDTWYHVALVRGWGGNANDFAFTVDGTLLVSTTTDATADISGQSGDAAIGARAQDVPGQSSLNGWIDEFRISKGIARWTADFTPPSAAYDDPSSTSSSSSSSSCRSSSSSSSSRSSSSSSSSSRSSSSSSSSSRSSSSSSSSSISSSSSSSSSSSNSSSSSSSSRSSSSSSRSSSSSSSSSKSSVSSSSSSSRSSSSSSSSYSSSSSSSSCRSSSSSSRSSSSSSSSLSFLPFRLEGINKISSTITYEQDEVAAYVADVDSDLKTIVAAINSGVKMIRVTTAQRNALTNLYQGLLVFNVSTNKLNFYDGTNWAAVTSV